MDWPPDWWGANFGKRSTTIRFKKAVPRRSDRRELSRLLRRAARSEITDRDKQLDTTLGQLVERRVPVASIRSDPGRREEILSFFDGTRLALDVRGGVDLTIPPRGALRPGARLGQATRCLGRCWYRLWFLLPYGGEGVEIMAKVALSLTG